jgi:ubiquinone/menaquinone biosynthesis C-methylase UbiE
MTEHSETRRYLPAAGHDLFLPFYDPLTKILGAERVRNRLVDQAALQPEQRVLEIGCGTGAVLTKIKRRYPDVSVVGLDPDDKALDRARRTARRAGVTFELERGFSNELPFAAGTFDRVFSCLMFHHLPDDEKQPTLHEVLRVLKPGGRFEMVDFAGPGPGLHNRLTRLFHSHERLSDNSEERILSRMAEARLARPRSLGNTSLLVGRVVFYQASAPD